MEEPVLNGQENELSLKDIILKLQEWWRYLLKKWLIILLFGLLGAGLGLTAALFSKPKYLAELTFILDEGKSGGLSAYAGVASQLGLNLGGGGSGLGVFSGDNIITFLGSRFIIEKTLLSPIQVDGKKVTLADYYMSLNKPEKVDPAVPKVSFPVGADRNTFSRMQDSVLFTLFDKISKADLKVEKPDKKVGFISVDCTSSSELFSKAFVERLVKESTDFYISTKTKSSQTNVDILQAKADSLVRLMNQKTYSAAVQEDLNLNPVRKIASVNADLLSRDKLVLQTVYGEVVKNLELSRMSMAQSTPVIQVVDSPILPLKIVKLGKAKGLIIGGLIGGLLICMFLIGRLAFRDIVK